MEIADLLGLFGNYGVTAVMLAAFTWYFFKRLKDDRADVESWKTQYKAETEGWRTAFKTEVEDYNKKLLDLSERRNNELKEFIEKQGMTLEKMIKSLNVMSTQLLQIEAKVDVVDQYLEKKAQ